MAYIDLIAVRLDPKSSLLVVQAPCLLVVQAPWCSPIEKGMSVMCETAHGKVMGIVEAVVHAVKEDEDTIEMVKVLAKMPQDKELGKVISYFEEKVLSYD